MNRFKCPACGGNQYTSADTAEEVYGMYVYLRSDSEIDAYTL